MIELDDVKRYVDPVTGLLTAPDGGKDNELLMVATFEHLGGVLPPEMMASWHEFVSATRIDLGLYGRYPGTKHNSVDNYIALAYSSVRDAVDIWLYGNSNYWYFAPTGKIEFKYLFGRFSGFRPYIKAAAGVKVNWFDALLFSIGAIFTALTPRGNTSDKCLQVLMNQWMWGCHWLSDLGIRIFEAIMNRKYLGLMGLYSVYFGPLDPFTLSAPTNKWKATSHGQIP